MDVVSSRKIASFYVTFAANELVRRATCKFMSLIFWFFDALCRFRIYCFWFFKILVLRFFVCFLVVLGFFLWNTSHPIFLRNTCRTRKVARLVHPTLDLETIHRTSVLLRWTIKRNIEVRPFWILREARPWHFEDGPYSYTSMTFLNHYYGEDPPINYCTREWSGKYKEQAVLQLAENSSVSADSFQLWKR